MRALVTGGDGFIGSHIVNALHRLGLEVVILDNWDPRIHENRPCQEAPKGIRRILGDVRDKVAWRRALEGVDYVFHEAAYQDYMPDYGKFFDTNVVGTALMFEVIREYKLQVRKIVVASSQAVYGEGQYRCLEHGRVLPPARSREQMARGVWELVCPICNGRLERLLLEEPYTNPCNPYAVSKFSQELTALKLGRMIDLPTVALRYSIVQGAGQSPLNAYSGICRIFSSRILSGDPLLLYEDGLQERDYCHVDDVVAANLLVAHSDQANFEAYNVGSGVPTTVLEYAQSLCSITGRQAPMLISGKYRAGDNRHSVSSVAKLRSLGWGPRKGLKDIITEYWQWICTTTMPINAYRAADQEMLRMGIVSQAEGGILQ